MHSFRGYKEKSLQLRNGICVISRGFLSAKIVLASNGLSVCPR